MRIPKKLLVLSFVIALVAAACGDDEGEEPTIGGPVTMARADWETGWMQAAIYQQLLEELGYDVSDPALNTREPNGFYPALATGQFDLWVNGWFPGHDRFFERTLFTGEVVSTELEPVGFQVEAGALQGYLVDKATADELGITSMDDLADPGLAAVFDSTGDGVADLAGCNAGWGCNGLIEDHIAEHEWGANVEQVVGDYFGQFAEVQSKVAAGEPVLFYTWTPNWTVAALVPGVDVVWLESTRLPDEEGESAVAGLDGCASDPCDLGFIVNDIRAVGRADFLDANPAVRRLLETAEIPLADIQAQNILMQEVPGGYTNEQVQSDASAWIAANRDVVDGWLDTARGG